MNTPSITSLKVYGLRRSGTNYLEQLLDQNVDLPHRSASTPSWVSVVANYATRLTGWNAHPPLKDLYARAAFARDLGWKHGIVHPDRIPAVQGRETLFVTITKNPYAWILSAHRSPHCPQHPDLCTFLESPWPALGRDNHTKAQYDHPIDLWNRKNRSYLQLAESGFPVVRLRYEDVLADPSSIVNQCADRYALPLRGETVTNVTRSTSKKKTAPGDKDRTFEDYQRYYLQREWTTELSPEHVRLVNRDLDRDLMQSYGYDVLSSDDVGRDRSTTSTREN